MGWTGCWPKFYDKNGRVDRKQECDAMLHWEDNNGVRRVLKSAMVGTTYYAAVEHIKPDGTRRVWAAVFLTSTKTERKCYTEFLYKDMDETCGPCECDCPVGILKLLTETDNQSAIDWRKRCWDRRNQPTLASLPIGTVIEFECHGTVYRLRKHEPAYQFRRSFWWNEEKRTYTPSRYIPKNFKVVTNGGN